MKHNLNFQRATYSNETLILIETKITYLANKILYLYYIFTITCKINGQLVILRFQKGKASFFFPPNTSLHNFFLSWSYAQYRK